MIANTVEGKQLAKRVPTNTVLQRIVDTGKTVLPSGEEVEATAAIDSRCGDLLRRTIMTVRPSVGIEVGLAFGISTLYILDALRQVGAEKLIGIDPAQHDQHWQGGGLRNIREAGFDFLYEFHEDTSQQVLPALVSRRQRIDFAFIDGWHTFDHVLLDFFYIDQMLNAGGVVVFDDVAYPSIKRACDFIITNRDYEVFDSVRLQNTNGTTTRWKRHAKRLLAKMVRTDKSPDSEASLKEHGIEDAYFLALRKRGDDTRRWDHFVHF